MKQAVIIRKEKEYVWIDTQAGSETESRPYGSLNHSYGAYLPGVLWPIILLGLVLSVYLVYLNDLPRVHASLSQEGFQ